MTAGGHAVPKNAQRECSEAIRLASMLRGMALQATKSPPTSPVSHGTMSMLVQALLDLLPLPLCAKKCSSTRILPCPYSCPGDIEDATRRNNGAPVQCLVNVCSHLDPNTSRFFDDQDEKLETVACGEQGVAWTGFDE